MTEDDLDKSMAELVNEGICQTQGVDEALRAFAVARELVPEPHFTSQSRSTFSTSAGRP